MSRHDILIVKGTHRGLLYEDGVLREVLPAGRYHIPRPPSSFAAFFGARAPKVEIVLVDVRARDRTVLVADLLTAEGATISASFVVQYRVSDARAAIHEVKNFEETLYGDSQTAARRALRGMSLDEVLASRDEIGEELFRQVRESAATYGLEVTGIDFKDLILPDDLRKILNRVASAKWLRQARLVEIGPDPDTLLPITEEPEIEAEPFADADADGEGDIDGSGLILAQMSFRRDPEALPRKGGIAFRPQPAGGSLGNGSEIPLRRFRP